MFISKGYLLHRRARGALLLLTLGGCQTQPQQNSAGPQQLFPIDKRQDSAQSIPLSAEKGQRLFSTLCKSCHGEEGRGDTPLAQQLRPFPADLSACNFKYRATPSGSLPLDDDLRRTLHVGLPGSAMPAFGSMLSGSAVHALMSQIKARCDRFGQEPPDPPLPAPARAYYKPDSVARGAKVYRRESCHSCHGDGGRGDGPAAAVLKDTRGQPVEPRDYTQGIFRGGFRRVDIFRAFSTGLDGTPMPALPEAVSERDRWDLTHYIVSLSHDRSKLLRALKQAPSWYEPLYTWGLPWR